MSSQIPNFSLEKREETLDIPTFNPPRIPRFYPSSLFRVFYGLPKSKLCFSGNFRSRNSAGAALRVFMDFCGFPWISMGFHGFSWIFMDFHWFPWISMGFHLFSWVFTDFHGFLWISMNFHRFFHGFLGVFTGFHGLPRIFTGFHGFPWVLMGFHRFSWIFNGFP